MKKIDNILGFFGVYNALLIELIDLGIFIGWKVGVKEIIMSDLACQILLGFIPALAAIFHFLKNIRRKRNGHNRFGIGDCIGFINTNEDETAEYAKATYPEVDRKMKSKKPQDLVMGKQGKYYVNIPIERDGINAFISGTPGSGKSVMIQNWLLTQLHKKELHNNKALSYNFFLVDVDGLIYKKIYPIVGEYDSEIYSELPLKIIEISNRSSYGWDVYYRLRRDNVTDTVILKTVSDIAESIVPESGDNPYFCVNARKILSGILVWGIYKKLDFVQTVQLITRNNLDELLLKICTEATSNAWNIVTDKLASFQGKATNESIQDVEATLKQYIEIFASYPDIVYALQTNRNKASPADMNDMNTSVIFSIETSTINVYQPLFRLVVMQMLRHIESDFSINDERNSIFIIDEAARCGKMDDLCNTIAVARKYHASIALLFQDMAQFNDIYGKEKAKIIQNLCELKIFLSGSGDKETVEYLDEIAGDYVAEKKSYQKSGLFQMQNDAKYTEDRRSIISGKRLMTLREKNEMIIIYFGKYYRIKKVYYFNDRKLKKLFHKVQEVHQIDRKPINFMEE